MTVVFRYHAGKPAVRMRRQRQQAAAPEDDYEEEMDAYNDFEDDGPPWDEDDPEPEEDNV